ncbi:MAG: hypothetical protein R2695_12575 [Acidimicrobiales bacterium]
MLAGTVLVDTNAFARTYDQAQWAHAFGMSNTSARADRHASGFTFLYEWFHGQPPPANETIGVLWYPSLMFPVLQGTGPDLTATNYTDTFLNAEPTARGALTQPSISFGTKGLWPEGVEPDFNGIDDVSEIWWDPETEGVDELDNFGKGVYWWVAAWPALPPRRVARHRSRRVQPRQRGVLLRRTPGIGDPAGVSIAGRQLGREVTADPGGGDLQPVVERDQIGAAIGGDQSPIVEAEHPRRHLRRRRQCGRDLDTQRHEPLHGSRHRERAPGQRAVGEAWGTVAQLDPGIGQPTGPPRRRVGHQYHTAGRLRPPRDLHQCRVNVDAVDDQADDETVVAERGTRRPGRPMVQRSGGVERVGEETGSGVDRGAGLLVGRGRVPQRGDDAAGGEQPDRVERPGMLRGERDDADDVGQGIEPRQIDRIFIDERMRAGGTAEVRALEVDTGDPGHAARDRGGAPLDPGQPLVEHGTGRTDQRRAPAGHPLGEEEGPEATPRHIVRGGHVDIVVPVQLEIDEPRRDEIVIGRSPERLDRGDALVLDHHAVVGKDRPTDDQTRRPDRADQFTRSRSSRRRIFPDALLGIASISSSNRICL